MEGPPNPPSTSLVPSYLSMGMCRMGPACRDGDRDSDWDRDGLAQRPAHGSESSTSAGEGNVLGLSGGSANLPPLHPPNRGRILPPGTELGRMGQAVPWDSSVPSRAAPIEHPGAGSGLSEQHWGFPASASLVQRALEDTRVTHRGDLGARTATPTAHPTGRLLSHPHPLGELFPSM